MHYNTVKKLSLLVFHWSNSTTTKESVFSSIEEKRSLTRLVLLIGSLGLFSAVSFFCSATFDKTERSCIVSVKCPLREFFSFWFSFSSFILASWASNIQCSFSCSSFAIFSKLCWTFRRESLQSRLLNTRGKSATHRKCLKTVLF